MSGYSFSSTAGASQSTTKSRLPGNDIYEVVFDGCEIKDVQGVKDVSKLYKQLILKFSTSDGSFEHTVWEPKPEDFKRTETEIKNKNGQLEKIPQPSNVESMMLLFKHAIDSINPIVAKQIDKGEKTLSAPDWESLRTLVSKVLDAGKGSTTKIKLLRNKNGEAVFPGFFSSLTKEGKAYVRNNFIGDKISFSAYEVERIKKESTAKPDSPDKFISKAQDADDSNFDMNFTVDDL
jgi:hypothetical protein